MIHQVVSDFSSFSGCLEMCHASNIPLSELVKCPTRHPICLIFASLEVVPRGSTALHLPFHITISRDSWQIRMITTNFCMFI